MRERTFQAGDERGFTLVEILASLVVLSIVGLTMTAFFTQAMSNAKGNQNKTVMVNLARNTLFYMQKQSNFNEVKSYYKVGQTLGPHETHNVISSDGCSVSSCSAVYEGLVKKPQTLRSILNPTINGISYRVKISFQEELYKNLNTRDGGGTGTGSAPDSGTGSDGGVGANGRMGEYLIPVKIEISEVLKDGDDNSSKPSRKRDWTEVEGYITDEKIR